MGELKSPANSVKVLEEAEATLGHALQQLVKLELTINKLELYHDPLSAGFNPILIDLVALVDSILQEFPPADRRWINVKATVDTLLILGDVYQLSFVIRTLLSYFVRVRAGDHAVSMNIDIRGGAAAIRIAGFLHAKNIDKQKSVYEDHYLSQVQAELQVGHSIINAFVANHSGASYSGKPTRAPP